MPNKIKKSDWKKEDIINSIIQMRTEKMATTKTILDFLMDDIGYGQAYAYILIKESREKIAEIYDRNNNSRIEESIAQLENMMEKAYLNKDYKLSYNIRQEMNKLVGLYAAQKVELSGEMSIKNIEIVIKTNESEDTSN